EADRSGPRPGLGHQRARILDVGQRRVGGLLDAAIEADAERVAGLEAALARVDAAATEGPLPTKRHVLERDRRRGSQGPERADPDSIADHPRASLARPDADLDVHLLDRPAAAGPGAAVEVHVGGRPRVRVEALVADAGGGRIAPVDVGERRRWLIFAGL